MISSPPPLLNEASESTADQPNSTRQRETFKWRQPRITRSPYCCYPTYPTKAKHLPETSALDVNLPACTPYTIQQIIKE